MVLGQPWDGTLIGSVRAAGLGLEPGRLRLKTADFPPLQAATFGSVRLGFQALNQAGPVMPFIVSKDGDQFMAVSAECTHQNCIIPAFTSAKVSQCPCHGSRFAPDGRVLRSPATAPLNSYDVEVLEPGLLQLTIPEFPAFEVTVEQVTSAGNGRVAVGFSALRNMQYEVVASDSASGPWKAKAFSTAATGAANSTVFTGTGAQVKLYVDRDGASGFYAVATKIRQV